jgi:ABC-type multidrug transport system ATPase subunit
MHANPSHAIAENAIVIEDLSFAYQGQAIFKHFNYSMLKGQLGYVTGHNGSGKTTLLKIISSLLRYSQGRVQVLGLDLKSQDQQIREKISCGFINTRGLFSHLTVEENLLLHGRMYGLSEDLIQQRISKLENLLTGKRKLYPSELSTGMRQIVQIAKVLLRPAELYLLDEPYLSLDQSHRHALNGHFQNLLHKGSTLIITVQEDELKSGNATGQVLCLA